jgi:hypothetical protein
MNLQNRIEEVKAKGYQLDFANVLILHSKLQKNSPLRWFNDFGILRYHFCDAAIIISIFGVTGLTTMLNPEL